MDKQKDRWSFHPTVYTNKCAGTTTIPFPTWPCNSAIIDPVLFNTAVEKPVGLSNYNLKNNSQRMRRMWKTLYDDSLDQKLTLLLVNIFEMTSAQPITSLYWSSDIRETFYTVLHQLYYHHGWPWGVNHWLLSLAES